MMINRHNYEEFFILYMDNELTVEQRVMVETFVKLHPDLKEELDNLLQYKLSPDTTIQFPMKEDLWKGDATLHAGNQSEWFLSYVDNELGVSQRQMVEDYCHNDLVAARELSLLLKTRLTAEPISFPDKASLYRREERRIRLYWVRIAAAVVFALLGITVFTVLSRNNNSANLPVANNVGPGKNRTEQPPTNNSSVEANDEPTPKEDLSIIPAPNKKLKGEIKTGKEDKEKLSVPDNKEAPLANNELKEKRSNNLPAPITNPALRPDEKAIASNNISEEFRDPNNLLRNTDVTTRTDQPSDIRTAANTPDDQEIPEQGRSGKKNKLRGFFRTISRTFEKRTNMDPTEDNKLLVAGFSINLK